MQHKMSDQDRAFIRANWAKLSVAEIAKHIGFGTSPTYRAGVRMGLGTKPRVKQATTKGRVAGQGQPVSFYEQVAAVFSELVSEREQLLAQLNALDGIGEDERGRVATQRASLNSRLSRVEDILVELEPIQEQSEALRPRVPDALHEITTFSDLIEYLTTKDARKAEGKLTEKVRYAADLLMQDWTTNLHKFEDGTVDQICLNADTPGPF